jgi:glyoxylase-like metal-dependent hydrolase (beta-lactamase superfamily II)
MSDFYKVVAENDNHLRITSLEGVFCELLIGADAALLIDTGNGFGRLDEVVRSAIGDKPLTVVNTHGHFDHCCGNTRFPGPVYIGQEDMELCRLHSGVKMRTQVAENAKNVMDYGSGSMVYGLPENFDFEDYISLGSGSMTPIYEGMTFELGGLTLRVLETPGHTVGGRSFFWEEAGTVFVGDAANPFLWLFTPEAADRATHVKTLDKLMATAPRKMYGGHAPEAMGIEHLKLFKRAALEAEYEKGFPFQFPLLSDTQARICCIDQMTPQDLGKPGFASIVISADR